MTTFDFNYDDGMPLDQEVLANMQASYVDILKAMVGFLRVPEVGSHVLFGCAIDGANITPGMMYIDGELCPFVGTPGTLATKIIKVAQISNLPFFDGSNNPVVRKTIAAVDVDGVALSEFTRYSAQLVFDPAYQHTDTNFTQPEKDKLAGIEDGAEENVQADWNATNPGSDAYIQNKPTGMLRSLHQDTVHIGDIWLDTTYNVNFSNAPLPTDDYIIVGSFRGANNADLSIDNNITWIVGGRTINGFKIAFREHHVGPDQDLYFDYLIIAL